MGLNVGSLFVQSYSGEDTEGFIDSAGSVTVTVAGEGALVFSNAFPFTGASVRSGEEGTAGSGNVGDKGSVGGDDGFDASKGMMEGLAVESVGLTVTHFSLG